MKLLKHLQLYISHDSPFNCHARLRNIELEHTKIQTLLGKSINELDFQPHSLSSEITQAYRKCENEACDMS